jgi:organic radical activating enzyme
MNAPLRKARPYVFWGQTSSLCETCLALVPAKILIRDNEVWYEKRCRQHGVQSTLVSTDAAYWRRCKEYIKPGDRPLAFQSRTELGCPYDCGLCPDHEQHSCLALIEINQHCNLTCPVCFADSSPERSTHLPLATIERMLDALIASEGEPDLVQLSGGEPTLHPAFCAILDAVRSRPIRHAMINTNGIRIAQEPDFVAELAERRIGLEVYLQFDSLKRDALMNLRGADLRRVRTQALENLERHNISTTLVVTVKRGVNDDEIGEIVRHALEWRCVRGVTFQPVQDVGRNENFDQLRDRMMLSEIRRRVVADSGVFGDADIGAAAVQSGGDLDRLRPAQRHLGAAGDLAGAARRVRRRHAQRHQLREAAGAEGEVHRAVLALIGTEQCRRAAGRIPLLPAQGAGARQPHLRERLPRRHRAVHGPVQFLRRRGQAVVHPLRHAGRPDHPVRHLQPVLPRRPHRPDPRAPAGRDDGMNEPRPPPRLLYTAGTTLMSIVGAILLVPGACALLFVPSVFTDPYVQFFAPVIVVSFLISGGGIWMMVAARRRALRAAQETLRNGAP